MVYPPVNPSGFSDRLTGPGAGTYSPRSDFGSGSMHWVRPSNRRWSRVFLELDSFEELPIVHDPPVNPGGFSNLLPGPAAGMYRPRSGLGYRSMLLGLNDPGWSRGVDDPVFHWNRGVPQGARYDPIGPPGVPGFGPYRFVRNPRRPGEKTVVHEKPSRLTARSSSHITRMVYPPVNPSGFSDRLPGPGAGTYSPRIDFGSGSMHLGPNDSRWSRVFRELDSFGGLPIVHVPPVNPGGFSDLLPWRAAGMYRPRSDFGSGSMLLGPNDPCWSRGVDETVSVGGLQGVPRVARYDPIGPPGVPGFEPYRFVRCLYGLIGNAFVVNYDILDLNMHVSQMVSSSMSWTRFCFGALVGVLSSGKFISNTQNLPFTIFHFQFVLGILGGQVVGLIRTSNILVRMISFRVGR
ncbi:hypothetical protein FNV43_RR22067 [Rhamnella rubrinervis]|uniref:Uncharacterized protein n=1 Tax=Rhamnella rubrinervis TaxID=2594499 RepID=A0A8K0GUU2_9ROSA|nr:hypothetical protein FNV43_RR22067 [Rhamnella rubrinervis]